MDNDIFTINILPIILFAILFLIVGIGAIISFNYNLNKECNKYKEEYNIMTEMNYDNIFNIIDNHICYVIMEDGTKINIDDFNIAYVKTPVKYRE